MPVGWPILGFAYNGLRSLQPPGRPKRDRAKVKASRKAARRNRS